MSNAHGGGKAPIRQVCESCDKKFALNPPDAAPRLLTCLHKFCNGCVHTFDSEAKANGKKGLACQSPGCNMLITSEILGLPVDTVSLRVHGGSGVSAIILLKNNLLNNYPL